MNLQIIMLGLTIAAANLFFAQCGRNFLQESQLPKEMPDQVEFAYSASGGMTLAYDSISIANDVLSVETLKSTETNRKKWSAKITTADKEKLYQAFVANKFDLIKKDEGVMTDTGTVGIRLTIDGKTYRIESSGDSLLSGDSAKRFQNVADAVRDLRARYEAKAEIVADNYVVIEYDARFRDYDFKNARPAALGKDEIGEVESLLKKAVDEYNARQKSKDQIINLAEYKRQFVPFVNEKGEKEIWVNCFCSENFDDWRTRVVAVEDGGKCFFNLRVNLTAKKYGNLNVNGEA